MSGFETVSAAFGVIHLAKLTISGLYQLLCDYKDAGKRLFEIVEDFDCFQWRLDLWSRTWHIGQTSPESEEAHIKALWSDTGAKFIVVQLASIDEDCRRFTRLMAKLMGDEHLKEQTLQNQLLESRIIELPQNAKPLDFLKSLTRRSRARQYRDILQLAHDSTSMKAKAHFVVSKGEALKELLKDLDNKFRKLEDDSLKAFCMRCFNDSKE
ncbi:hypothetical protein SLS56_007666 [Neofusicoccum ribis]|uniref:Prion-inhibition and propagation HeLo domain-containing protein n=1 Tax=Neofusicoccum ribis TaxID=45134 RepID=A0ABR3SN05_9PEZI